MVKLDLPRRRSRAHRAGWLGLLAVTALVAKGTTAAQPVPAHPAPAPVLLRLRTGAYDPLRTASVARAGAAAPAQDLCVVQFNGPIRVEWRRALEATGATVIDYLPDFAYLVRATPSVAARFGALPGHRWHGIFTGAAAAHASLADASRQVTRGATVLLDVMTWPGEDVWAVMRRLPGRVVQRFARRRGFLRVQVTPDAAARVAATPGVAWVEPYVPPVLFNDVAAGLMQVPQARDDLGLYGRGQVVAVADTGLDVGSSNSLSADFRGRLRRAYALNRASTGDWSDLIGHGTHVCGSVLGAGVLSGSDPAHHRYDGSFAGMAPEASLVMQSIGSSTGALSLPADLGQLLLPPYQNDGARIHSDSWGGGGANITGQYLLSSWEIDDICWQARDLVVLFAAGNGGVDADGDGVVDPNSLSPQAAAKNAIAVGASESARDQSMTWGAFSPFPSEPLQGDRLADNPGGMAAFSSRGPTADGRIKPDIVAPGTWILSARSHAFGAGTLWGAYNADYDFSGGTSMAAPLAAGAAALLREGLQERYGIANPSSALVKALFINGADELAPGQYGTGAAREIPPRPNPVEGWGRVDVRQSLGSDGTRAVFPVDDTPGLQTEERRKYSVTVVAGQGPLRVTLAWTDPPSSLLAGPQLVNDLDLKLLTPDGRWLYGNGGTDRLNNVEAIELPQPASGGYTVIVDGYNVPQGPQPFALVASGPIQPPGATGLRGWLHDGPTGLPLSGADVAVTGSRSLSLTANSAGRLEARLPAGSYTLTPTKPGWTFGPPSRSVTLADGQVLSVEFAATAASGALTGVLTDRSGAPVAGAPISLAPGDQTAVTATDGSYRFPALPPLLYTVAPSVAGTAFAPESRRVLIPAGGSARADFTAATAAVSGTVVATGPVERQAIASAHPAKNSGTGSWTVSRPGAHWIRVHFSRIDVQPGAERVEVLDAGRNLVSRWGGAFTDVWSRWAAGSSVTLQHITTGFYARYGFEMDGVQTDLGGQPVTDAAVALQPGGRAARTDASGGFRFSGLSGASFSVAPALKGWEFFPPLATVSLPPGGTAGTVTFLAQGPPSLSGHVLAAGITQAARFESLHPYANGSSRAQEIAVPGATRLRLHFARLATEYGADFVRVLGPDGAELKRFSGPHADFWTDWLPAARVTVKLDTDDSINDWGFLIDMVESDASMAAPVPGATVTLSPGGASAVTGADGSYRVPQLAAGSYTLTPSGPGLQFTPGSLTVTIPAWGASGVNLEATRAASPATPGVIAALSPAGQPEVRGWLAGNWSSLPEPGPGPFDRLLALRGVNDTPELIALAGGKLLHCRFDGSAWTAWQTLPGPGTDRAPVAAAELDGTLDVLAVGPDGAVQHLRFVNGTWQAPVIAAGVPAWEADRAALASRDDGTLELVAAGADGRLQHARFLNGAWTTPGTVGDRTTALRPALAIGTDGAATDATLELVFVGEDGAVLEQRFRAGAWSAPVALRSTAGLLTSNRPPALAAGPDARLELVVATADGLYHGRVQAGAWSDATRISSLTPQAIALAAVPQADPPGSLELFATAADGTVTDLRFHDGRWTPPTPLDGLLAAGGLQPASR